MDRVICAQSRHNSSASEEDAGCKGRDWHPAASRRGQQFAKRVRERRRVERERKRKRGGGTGGSINILDKRGSNFNYSEERRYTLVTLCNGAVRLFGVSSVAPARSFLHTRTHKHAYNTQINTYYISCAHVCVPLRVYSDAPGRL